MSFLLDTDICSAYMRGNARVRQRFLQHSGRLHVSAVTVGELYTWALRASAPPDRHEKLQEMLADLTVLPVDADVGRRFGALRAALFDAGRPTPDMDLLVAATAQVHDLTLVTHNVADFACVPGLRVSDWLAR